MRARIFCVIMLFAVAVQSHADIIAIIGTGSVAKALGHTIIYGSREPGAEKVLDLVAETSGDASAALPIDAFVVKAFSTLNWRQMVNPDGAITILLAGDSDDAKQRVAELVSGMGLEPLDLGSVENAHWIEGMTILWMNNRISSRPNFEIHLRQSE